MALFDKIKKPDLSSFGQKMKDAADNLSDKSKKVASMCTDGLSSAASVLSGVGQDVCENVVGGVKIMGDAVMSSAECIQNKLQGMDIKGMFDSVNMSEVLNNIHKYENNYSESSLWDKIKEVGSKVGGVLTYNIMLLLSMATSKEVSIKDKALIIGALGYFILPTDAIPDIIAGIGYYDDMGSIAYALGKVQKSLTPEIEKDARSKTERIFGKSDEAWFKNPEEAIQQAKEAKSELDYNYLKASTIVKSIKK